MPRSDAEAKLEYDQRNPELERAIFANPYDTDAYSVYADWLQEQGDPRGELIPLQLTDDTELSNAAAVLLERHAAYFLGPLAPLLERTDLRKLRRLGLVNAEFTDELCETLPRSKLLAGIAELDLSKGCLTDQSAQALAANAAAFRHLDVLDVSENYLTESGLASLAKLAKKVVGTWQRADDPAYRHSAVGE